MGDLLVRWGIGVLRNGYGGGFLVMGDDFEMGGWYLFTNYELIDFPKHNHAILGGKYFHIYYLITDCVCLEI